MIVTSSFHYLIGSPTVTPHLRHLAHSQLPMTVQILPPTQGTAQSLIGARYPRLRQTVWPCHSNFLCLLYSLATIEWDNFNSWWINIWQISSKIPKWKKSNLQTAWRLMNFPILLHFEEESSASEASSMAEYVNYGNSMVVVVVVVGLKGTKQLRLYNAQTLSKRAQHELHENKRTKPKRNKSERTKTKISN